MSWEEKLTAIGPCLCVSQASHGNVGDGIDHRGLVDFSRNIKRMTRPVTGKRSADGSRHVNRSPLGKPWQDKNGAERSKQGWSLEEGDSTVVCFYRVSSGATCR